MKDGVHGAFVEDDEDGELEELGPDETLWDDPEELDDDDEDDDEDVDDGEDPEELALKRHFVANFCYDVRIHPEHA